MDPLETLQQWATEQRDALMDGVPAGVDVVLVVQAQLAAGGACTVVAGGITSDPTTEIRTVVGTILQEALDHCCQTKKPGLL